MATDAVAVDTAMTGVVVAEPAEMEEALGEVMGVATNAASAYAVTVDAVAGKAAPAEEATADVTLALEDAAVTDASNAAASDAVAVKDVSKHFSGIRG